MKDHPKPSLAVPALLAAAFGLMLAAAAAMPDASASNAPSVELTQVKANRYIGAQKCKTCHGKDETGNQHKVWSAGKHAHAFAVLATDRAKEVGKAQGIADPQKDAACIQCHQTAYGLDAALIQKGFDPTLGVQCETCHGPGEQHMLARMKAAREKVDGYPKIPDGEIITMPSKDSCAACHNEKSPTFQPFCVHERLEKMKHWNPNRPRTEEQKKGYPCTCDDTCICKKDSPEHKCRDAK